VAIGENVRVTSGPAQNRSSRRAVAITLPVEGGLSAPQLVDLATRAETEGFHYAVCGEVASVDALVLLGAILSRTERIKVATCIIATTLRTPQMAAMGFATLSSLAPGRVVAGLGASSPIIVNKWNGRPFDKPLAATREFIEVFRAALTREKVFFTGNHVRSDGFALQIDPQGDIPIWLGAINDRMLELAGEISDGVFLTWCPPAEIGERLDKVRVGADAAGRALSDVEVTCSFWACAGDGTKAALESARRVVLQYAMVPTHQHAFVGAFPSLAAAAEAWNAGDRKAALALLDDEVVHTMCAIGTPEHVADRVGAYHDAGVDVAIILPISPQPGNPQPAADTYFSVAKVLRERGTLSVGSTPERNN
jgi:probable F420-dependent oxidoreductase